MENIKLSIHTAKLMQMMPKHIFGLITDTLSRCCFTPIRGRGRGHFWGHVTKMAVTPFDRQMPKTLCCTQISRLYLLNAKSPKFEQ